MEIAVSALRADLRQWIDAARSGEEVVITERGIPVARLSGVASSDLLARLERDGLVTPPSAARPHSEVEAHAAGRPASAVSDLVRRLRR